MQYSGKVTEQSHQELEDVMLGSGDHLQGYVRGTCYIAGRPRLLSLGPLSGNWSNWWLAPWSTC